MTAENFGEFAITVDQETGYRVKDVADFLSCFQSLYIECFPVGRDSSIQQIIDNQNEVLKFKTNGYKRLVDNVNSLEERGINVPDVHLIIKSIELNSPLKVVFYGILPAIAMAVIYI